MNSVNIKEYWDNKVRLLQTNPSATMRDVILRSMEIESIRIQLREDDNLIDVGGGNAFGAIRWADFCSSVLVTDFSKEMISSSITAIANSGKHNIRAEIADVLDLSRFAEQFSVASIVRCLINLPQQEQQYKALAELHRVLRPNGRLFLIEGFSETFEKLNKLRRANGLNAISLHWHNLLLPKLSFEEKLRQYFHIERIVDFGVYYFISRIIHPILVAPEEPQFEGRMNHIAHQIWRSGCCGERFTDISTLLLYIARKK